MWDFLKWKYRHFCTVTDNDYSMETPVEEGDLQTL